MGNNSKTIVPQWVKIVAFVWAFCGGLLVDNTAEAWAVYISGVGVCAVIAWAIYAPQGKGVRNE